jgi:hypothetical protein
MGSVVSMISASKASTTGKGRGRPKKVVEEIVEELPSIEEKDLSED